MLDVGFWMLVKIGVARLRTNVKKPTSNIRFTVLLEQEQALVLTNIQNPTSNIGLRRSRFPAAMEPQPLIGILADHSFEMRVKDLGIERSVASDRKRRVKFEDVFPLFLR